MSENKDLKARHSKLDLGFLIRIILTSFHRDAVHQGFILSSFPSDSLCGGRSLSLTGTCVCARWQWFNRNGVDLIWLEGSRNRLIDRELLLNSTKVTQASITCCEGGFMCFWHIVNGATVGFRSFWQTHRNKLKIKQHRLKLVPSKHMHHLWGMAQGCSHYFY